MTAMLLLTSLHQFLGKAVAEYSAGKGSLFHPPKVIVWHLPIQATDPAATIDYSYIVSRIVQGNDTNAKLNGYLSLVQTEILFGVYYDANQTDGSVFSDGANDLVNMMEYIRTELLRTSLLDNKYRLELDGDSLQYVWEIAEEQTYPLWVGRARCFWSLPSVVPEYPEADVFAHKLNW